MIPVNSSGYGDDWLESDGRQGFGRWIPVEIHFKNDTDGTDGIIQTWVDETLIIDRHDLNFGVDYFEQFGVGSNGNAAVGPPDTCVGIRFDDLALATTEFADFVDDGNGYSRIGLINHIASDIIPPVRSNSFPTGELNADTTAQDISLSTDEDATCKYSAIAGTNYAEMTQFTNTTGTNHTTEVTGLENGFTYNYYVKCQDNATPPNTNTDDYAITFNVAHTQSVANNASSSSRNCFIATAAYGTSMAEEVKILSRFRDQHLLTNYYGKIFVNMYYQYSPKIASYIRQRDWARAVVRLMLKTLVNITK
ncbi:MAG: hypothetical protein DRP78_04390 [Candidatus Omnitrophota bacterium]|nr:MAG: hypothetical protein DRP78_04390 [Candidatus Omnitrophota bacterium]